MARPDKISGADINSICQEVINVYYVFSGLSSFSEMWSQTVFLLQKKPVINFPFFPPQAGMLAVRENRYIVLAKDFEKAYKTVIKKDEQEHEFYK